MFNLGTKVHIFFETQTINGQKKMKLY